MNSPQKQSTPITKEVFMMKSYHITLHAQNATTIIVFIVMAKIPTAIRNTFAVHVNTNLHRTVPRRGRGKPVDRASDPIRPVLAAVNPASCIMTMCITRITAAQINAVIILCAKAKRRLRSFYDKALWKNFFQANAVPRSHHHFGTLHVLSR